MALRLRQFQKSKNAAGCRTLAEKWEALNRTDALSLYDAACFRAVTAAVLQAGPKSASTGTESAAEAERAMTWLRQAVAAGYTDLAHLKTDRDLDALRNRTDFKALLAELGTTKPGAKNRFIFQSGCIVCPIQNRE
jgi:hypothetical protein